MSKSIQHIQIFVRFVNFYLIYFTRFTLLKLKLSSITKFLNILALSAVVVEDNEFVSVENGFNDNKIMKNLFKSQNFF